MHNHENCCDMPQEHCEAPMPIVSEFDCGRDQQVTKHKHIVRHHHDIVNEYDVVHEHIFNKYDIVRESEVAIHNDCTTHCPNYCDRRGGFHRPVRPTPRHFSRRRFW